MSTLKERLKRPSHGKTKVGKLVLGKLKKLANLCVHTSNSRQISINCNMADVVQWHSRRVALVSWSYCNVNRRRIIKVTGHKNIQSLNDYNEANEDEQRKLSYAINGRKNFNPQTTVSREVHDQQQPLLLQFDFFDCQ